MSASGRAERRTKRHYDVFMDAVNRYHECQSALRDERIQALSDRRFCDVEGSQWEGPLEKQFKEKPKFEINKTRAAVLDIISDYQNNRIGPEFVPVDGVTNTDLADTCGALFRRDEQQCDAQDAYDNGFQEMVKGGMGGWRLRAKYEDERVEDTEGDQRIVTETIPDADSSIFWDLNSKKRDKSDALFCFVVTAYTRHHYMAVYGDDPGTWGKLIHQYEFDWLTPDMVYVAEYYLKKEYRETTYWFKGIAGDLKSHTESEFKENPGLKRQLKVRGYRKIREVIRKKYRVFKYTMNGRGLIEKPKRIAGEEIPVVVTVGHWAYIDNVERIRGHVRGVKDVQRLKNMQVSALAEIAGRSTYAKPIVTPEQMAGLGDYWKDDNLENFAYLPLNAVMGPDGSTMLSGPIGWTKTTEIPPALPELLRIVEQDLQDLMRSAQPTEKVLSHVSGKAIEAIKQQIDRKSLPFIMGMARAIRRTVQIWLSMAKELYAKEGREMTGMLKNGQLTKIKLKQKISDPDTGLVTLANDLSRANFDVTCKVGPNAESQEDATVTALTNMMGVTEDPETKLVFGLSAVMHMTGEGISEVKKWVRMKLVKMNVLQPTPEEAQQLQQAAANAKPSAQDQMNLAVADREKSSADKNRAQLAHIAAQTDKTKVDALKVVADIHTQDKTTAIQAAKTLSDIHVDQTGTAVDAAESLHGMLNPPNSSGSSPGGPS